MRIDQKRLIVLALAVIKEAVLTCERAPLQPSLALRFALRFLWAHSMGPKFPYDGFLKAIQDPGLPDKAEWAQQYCRFTDANGSLKAIIRSVGMPETPEFDQLLAAMCGSKEDQDRYRASQAFKRCMEEKRRHDEWKRRGRECEIQRPNVFDSPR